LFQQLKSIETRLYTGGRKALIFIRLSFFSVAMGKKKELCEMTVFF